MANYDPPNINSNIFNASYFTDLDGSLSLAAADLRYLKLSGGVVSGLATFSNSLNVIGTLSINGDAIDLSLISGVVAGTPQNSKALSLDALGKINGDLSLTGALNCSQLNANLTSSGLSWQSIAGTSSIALNHTLNGTALLGSTTNTAFGFLTNNTERVRILNNGNFGIGTATAGYKLDVNGDINSNTILRINRTSNGQSFNSTNGTSTCVLYHFNNGDAYFGPSTVNNLVFQTQNTARMTIDSLGAISGISSLSTTSLIVNGISVSSSDLNYLSSITPGTVTASKALIVDSNKRITGIDRINITSSNNTTTTGTTTSSNFALNILSTANSNGQYNSAGIAFLNAASDDIPHAVIQSIRTASSAGDIVLSTRSAANNLSENLRILSTGALSINYGSSPDAMLSCIGSSSYSSANYQRLLRLETSNVTPIKFGIHLNLNTAATITNSTYVGNLTANDLHFGTNTSAFMALKHTGSMVVIGGTTAISSTHKLEILGSTLISDSTNTYTMPSTPSLGILNGAHTNNSRIEYQTIGKYVNSSDYSAWTTSIYYQNVTGDTANYITWCPSAKTSTSTGFGMVMNRNGQVSFQDSNSNSGSGGLVVGGNIIATVDIYGGVTRSISANGELRSNATPAVYNPSGGTTRIGLFVQNAIWTSDKVFSSSDDRLKRNIEPIELNEAKKLLNISSVSYRWKKDTEDHMKDIGFIAQDFLENKLDKLVSFCPSSDKDRFPMGYSYGLEYQKVCVYQNELIKDLYDQMEELKNEILLLKDTTKKY